MSAHPSTEPLVTTSASAAKTESGDFPSSGQAWYLVFTLLVFYIFSFIDRQIISLLVEPIKRDLGVNDTQVGLLQGLSFALLYCTLGIPIGWLADRKNRKTIIAVGVIVWSVMASLCGMAKNFSQLFLARIGVGVGEAALSPAAYSMITDSFPKEKLGRAFSVYNMGISIGSGVALLVGGLVVASVSGEGSTFTLPLIGEVRAWQFVFIVTGAPGILLPLLLLLVREPKRRGLIRTESGEAAKVPLKQVFAFMVRNGDFYSLHFVALALFACLGYGVGAWLPTVMARTYNVPAATVGQVLGVSTLVINTLGIFLAGRICDWLGTKGYTDAPIRVLIGTAVLVTITSPFPAFMPTALAGFVMMCVAGLPFHAYVAMGPMVVNQVTPNQMRAQMSSLYLFVNAMIGMTIGPALVPFISDYILKDPQQIRWALGIVVIGCSSLAGLLLVIERRRYLAKIAATSAWA